MPTLVQLWEWLQAHPCTCDVSKAVRCSKAAASSTAACHCECHAMIAQFHNDRTYTAYEYTATA